MVAKHLIFIDGELEALSFDGPNADVYEQNLRMFRSDLKEFVNLPPGQKASVNLIERLTSPAIILTQSSDHSKTA